MSDEADMLVLLKMISTLEKKLEQTEADRDVLAAEVIKWRQLSSCEPGDEIDVAAQRTDASGALQRAKEAK